MSELYKLGIEEAAKGLAKGEFTSVELTQAVIDRVHARDGEIGAYLTFDEEGALAAAKAADVARSGTSAASSLLGVPVAIKDLINVRGQPCTCASKILKGYVSPYDATVIKNLKSAGAVCAGRVNMDEFAMGSSTENSGLGRTVNPYDTSRVPGGSSGGSAAAVGGDLAIAALGTDTGGSIRQPASFCNCVGLKPSYGRVSRFGVTAFASSLDQVGPMTKSVTDAALLLQALAGHDEMDGTTPDIPVPDYAKALEGASLKGVKLGLPKEYFIDGLDPEVKAVTDAAVKACADAGAELVEVSLPHTEYAMAVSLRAQPRGGLRPRGEAPHHHGHLRALKRLLRRLLRPRPQGAHAHPPRLRGGVQAGRRAPHARRSHARVQGRRGAGPSHDVPERPLHDPRLARGQLLDVDPGRFHRLRAPARGRAVRGGRLPRGQAPAVQFVADAFREDKLLRIGKAFEDAVPPQRG